MNKATLEESFLLLAKEARELYLDRCVPVLIEPPSPLVFYREFVSKNRPVIVKNAFNHWPALKRWNKEYLRGSIGDTNVTVAVTPNGYADAVTDNHFVMPEERLMSFNEFLDKLDADPVNRNNEISNDVLLSALPSVNSDNTCPCIKSSSNDIPVSPRSNSSEELQLRSRLATTNAAEKPSNGVFYIQKQNSNFHTEFAMLAGDVGEDIAWATEAFGKKPDAVNMWMGDCRAVTSLHKDHYENIYCVVSGVKRFTLLPPTDQPFLPYEEYPAAVYKENEYRHFDMIDDGTTGQVPWIAIDVLSPDLSRYPLYAHARPLSVDVHAGDLLYLPSLWFHHVQQSHGCIAVNYWYDMEFDIKYCYYKLVESFTKRLQ